MKRKTKRTISTIIGCTIGGLTMTGPYAGEKLADWQCTRGLSHTRGTVTATRQVASDGLDLRDRSACVAVLRQHPRHCGARFTRLGVDEVSPPQAPPGFLFDHLTIWDPPDGPAYECAIYKDALGNTFLRRWHITRRQAWLLRTNPFGGYR